MPESSARFQKIRGEVRRYEDDRGQLREAAIKGEFNITGTLGEVVSLSPPSVELLDGRTIRPRAYVGPVPSVGQTVLILNIAKWPLVVTGIEVI